MHASRGTERADATRGRAVPATNGGPTMNEKEQRMMAFCKQHGFDGVLLRRRSNIAWITDGADVHCDTTTALGVASVLWTPQRKMVLTDNIEAARLREEEFGDEWETREGPWWEADSVAPVSNRCVSDWPDDAIAELRY